MKIKYCILPFRVLWSRQIMGTDEVTDEQEKELKAIIKQELFEAHLKRWTMYGPMTIDKLFESIDSFIRE